MDDDFYTARIDATVADLIPTYLRNRHKEVSTLKACLESSDFDKIALLAHRMIGVGTPYGFPYISNLAKVIREAALGRQLQEVRTLVDDYDKYLRVVKIVVR